MWKGNDCNALQKDPKALNGGEAHGYSDNLRLVAVAQSDDREEADRATELLVTKNAGLVRSIALRFRDRGIDMEDLLQIGSMGLLRAIRSFDLSRGTEFSTYAVPLIFGELRRYMRDEGPIKVGRYYKKLGATLLNEKNRISLESGREPTIRELARLCGVSAEEAAMALSSVSPVVSLSDSAYGDDDDTELGSVIPDEESLGECERICNRIAIAGAVSKMPEQWQKIVALRFYRNMTQQQTANILGITQVKVSREEKKIIESLKMYLA